MKVIAIDPGFDRLGVAILEKEASEEKLLFSDCLLSNKKEKYEDRLKDLGERLETLIEEYKPEIFACEALFFAKNQKTAIDVAGARGMFLYIARKHSLPVYEYKPNQIKIAMTGYGSSDKNQVTDMVKRLVVIEKEKALDDEYDAIAVGLTCLATERF